MIRLLTARPGWDQARDQLAALREAHGAEAEQHARAYSQAYAGRRGAMVVDVIASRQRRYQTRVRDGIVPAYLEQAPGTLAALADDPPTWLALRRGEAQTMTDVAAGLLRWAADHGCDGDDDAARSWAEAAEEVRFAPRLDPYAGGHKGVGPALFAYLRMRSGADALKPDLRVHRALRSLGLRLPNEPRALLTAAEALADDLSMDRLVLDQLLWRLPASGATSGSEADTTAARS